MRVFAKIWQELAGAPILRSFYKVSTWTKWPRVPMH